MNDDLVIRIRDDLEKSGMRSELVVRRTFIERRWSLSGGAAFLDRDEGKSREIDIRAAQVRRLEYQGMQCCFCEFDVIAEVKKSERPWVVFKQPQSAGDSICAWNNLTTKINLPCKPAKLVRAMSKSSLLVRNGWAGSGIHEAFKNPDQPSRWYSAFVSVCKAADGLASLHKPKGDETTADIINNPIEFIFYQPLVVLDGQLISAELSDDGSIVIEEVSSAAFQFEYNTREYKKGRYRVDLVTMDGLGVYLDLLAERHNDVLAGFMANSSLPLKQPVA